MPAHWPWPSCSKSSLDGTPVTLALHPNSVVNISEVVRGLFQSAYLGFYAHAAHAGQGLMTEGLAYVVTCAFRVHHLHRLEANIQPGNEPSRRLVQRLGFRREGFSPRYLKIGGRWRDHERWAVTSEAWRAGRPRAGGSWIS